MIFYIFRCLLIFSVTYIPVISNFKYFCVHPYIYFCLQLTVTSITNTSITLQWKPPSITNGVLQSYQIFYNQHQQKLAANETETTLINLTSYETYEIKLQACTLICSEPTHSIFVRTKIGVPAHVEERRHQNLNSTHVNISWSRPAIPAGPQPRYRVRMRLEGADNETKDKLTTNNSIVVDLSNCRSGSYSVDVRAENVNETSNEVFEGPWLQAFSQVCSSGTGMSLSWKIIIFFTLMLLLGSIFVILGKKGLYKCKQMKSVEVAIPAKFIEPRLFSLDRKEAEFYEDFSVPRTKSVEEFYSLVDQTAKTTEMVSVNLSFLFVFLLFFFVYVNFDSKKEKKKLGRRLLDS